jgi:hypothetical protein
MSRVVVGRIFWKEVRTQRSLWFGVLGLAIAIQTLFTAMALTHSRWFVGTGQSLVGIFLAAYVGVAIYAIASGAASFTEEHEGQTATFLRTIPMTPAEACTGKWAYGLVSTGLLLLTLLGFGAVCTAIGWNEFQPVGALAKFVESARHLKVVPVKEIVSMVWIGLAIPIATFAFCAFFSLVLSDGVLAALCGTFSTIFAVSAALFVGVNTIPSGAIRLSAIALTMMSLDYWLTGIWLREETLFQTGSLPRRATNLRRSSTRLWSHLVTSLELLRLGEPVAPWRRVTQRLVWKECRQAGPFAKMSGLIALVAIIVSLAVPAPRFVGDGACWFAVMAMPLVMGVGSYYVEQNGRAYRMLGDRGAPAEGAWIIKQTIWMLHAIVTCGIIVYADDLVRQYGPDTAFGVRPSVADTIRQAFSTSPEQLYFDAASINRETMKFALFYIVLAYSIAQRFSFSFPKGPLAFGMATGTTMVVCLIWYIFASRGIPIGWTIGLIPVALLAYTGAHSAKWQIQKSGTEKWYLATGWFLTPFVGIAVAAYLYWPQITMAVWRYSQFRRF